MKDLFCSFLLTICSMMTWAQTVPDFTVTDSDGIEHDLYADYLNNNEVVILYLFLADCEPCQEFAPSLQTYWDTLRAQQMPVQVLGLSGQPEDLNIEVDTFKMMYNLTFPLAGSDGGSVEAQAPYATGDFGTFVGYPTLVVIDTDRTVQFDPWVEDNFSATIDSLMAYVNIAGTSEIKDLVEIELSPNPVKDFLKVELTVFGQEKTLQIYTSTGQLVRTITSTDSQEIIPTTELATGNYFLLVQDGRIIARKQFTVVN